MAVVINLSDPGAVPGASTRAQTYASLRCVLGWGGGEIGSTRGVKGVFLLGMVPPLSGHLHSCERQLCSGCSGRVSGLKDRSEALASQQRQAGFGGHLATEAPHSIRGSP